MTNQHPLTPPRGLVVLLRSLVPHGVADALTRELWLINRAYAAGADQELEACCEWVDWKWSGIKNRELRAARRPKPPSLKGLKEQALRDLNHAYKKDQIDDITFENIQEALEALPNE